MGAGVSSDASKRAKQQPRGMPGNAGQFRPQPKPIPPVLDSRKEIGSVSTARTLDLP